MENPLIDFLNKCNTEELIKSLNELDIKISNIEKEAKSSFDEVTYEILKDKDAYFFTWFCFLRANF